MLAYHNNQSIKTKYVNRMKAHMEADALIQGTGWDGHKGCAVGCTFKAYDHARGPIEIGVPETLMRLEDAIFEGLSYDDAREFPLAFLEAIPVGADLSLVWPRFAVWLLSDPQFGVLRHCNDTTRPSVETVIGLYRRWVDGDKPSGEECESAMTVVRGAARTAMTAEAAWTAARSVARAAMTAEAAWAAARVAARAAARAAEETVDAPSWEEDTAFWRAARDELFRLLREAPVAVE